MTDSSFCTKCGQRVSGDAIYCPSCGAPIEGRVDPRLGGMNAQEFMEKQILDSKVSFNLVLLLIYGLPVIITGIYDLIRLDQLTAILVADDMIQEAMIQYNLSSEDIRSILQYGGALITASGAFTLISAFCVYKRKYWVVAVATCGLASILCTWSIFGLLIGLLVTWSIASLKPVFDLPEEPPAAE